MTLEIIDYVAPIAENPYAGAVEALLEAGEGKAARIVVPLVKANTERNKIGKAANDLDKTARFVAREEDADSVTFTIILTPKNAKAGKARSAKTLEDGATEPATV